MKKTRIYLCYCIIANLLMLMFFSCNGQYRNADIVLTKVENIVEQYPDSALSLLSTIISPHNLGEYQYNKYILLSVQAKDKDYQDISTDTLIFEAKGYFVKQNDIRNSALASFYSGRVLQEQNKNEEAVFAYLEAASYANDFEGGDNLKGIIETNIGYALYDELLYDDALIHFKKAKNYFNISQNVKHEIASLKYIGDSYLLNKNTDSAFYYYQKSLELADLSKDSEMQMSVRHNLGVIYKEQGEYKKAKEYFSQALTFIDNTHDQARLYSNVAQVFHSEQNSDSASYYLHKSLDLLSEIDDLYLISRIYEFLYILYEEDKNYLQSLKYQQLYTENMKRLFEENENKAILEIQNKYDYEQIKNRNSELLINRQYTYLVGLILLLLFLLVVFYFYGKYLVKKRKLSDAHQKIIQLDHLALSFDEEKDSFRNRLLQHFDILKKAALFELSLRENEREQGEKLLKKFNEIVYNQETLDWDVLYKIMNDLHYGFLDQLKKEVPLLDETEFRICCLLYTDFSNTEIGVIMKLSSSTITHKRSSIREKIGLEKYGNITEYLKNIVVDI